MRRGAARGDLACLAEQGESRARRSAEIRLVIVWVIHLLGNWGLVCPDAKKFPFSEGPASAVRNASNHKLAIAIDNFAVHRNFPIMQVAHHVDMNRRFVHAACFRKTRADGEMKRPLHLFVKQHVP